MENNNNNNNYVLKDTGYLKNYIYSYSDYLFNTKVLSREIIKDRIGLLYFNHKTKLISEFMITTILYFNDKTYNEWTLFMEKIITKKLKEFKFIKELKGLQVVLKLWLFRDISNRRAEIKAQEKFDKKLLRFQKVVNKLVDYKVETANNKMFSRFLSERILIKELKPVLHIKVKDAEKQEECIQHLLNLMSKKWLDVTHDTFKQFFHRAIKVHQDNWEHKDAWHIKEKKKNKDEVE